MNLPGIPVHDNVKSTNHYTIIIFVFVVAHGLLFWHDINHPESFRSGDRSGHRMRLIHQVFGPNEGQLSRDESQMDSVLKNVVAIGDPGDYLFHGIVYSAGGSYAVITLQIVLSLIATLILFKLILLLRQPPNVGLLATLMFILLPGNLMQSHLLVTESIYTPAVIFAIYFLVLLSQTEFQRKLLYFSALFLAFGILIRIQLIFYPIIVAIIVLLHYPKDVRRYKFTIPAFLLVCYAYPVTWTCINYTVTGTIGLGARDNSLSEEFFETAKRMSIRGVDFDASNHPDGTMPLADFWSLVWNYPWTYITIELSDLFNTYLNPGFNHFVGRYLELVDVHEKVGYWRNVRDQEGILGVLAEIVRSGPVFAVSFFVAGVVWSTILFCSVLGVFFLVRSQDITRATKTILLSYIVYATLVLHAASSSRWAYRTHFEFVLMVFFVVFLSCAMKRNLRRPRSST